MQKARRFDSIQFLRALAALSVVMFHSKLAFSGENLLRLWTWRPFSDLGDLGVSLFFVISGFIIANSVSSPRFSVGVFAWRRFMRLYPLYWIVMGAALYAYHLRGWFAADIDTLGTAGMIKSFLIFPQQPFPFLNPGWSLEHEIIFYAIAAVVVPLFGLRVLAGLLAVLWAVGRTVHLGWDYHLFADPQIYFAAGVVAYLYRDVGWRIAAPTAGAMLGFAYSGYYGLISIGFYTGLAFAAGCAALIVTLVDVEQSVKIPKLVITIGDASYSLYLWHWLVVPICSLGAERLGGYPELWRWVIVAASITISMVSYQFIEAPIIALSHWKLKKSITV